MVEKVLQLNNEKTIFWSLLGILLLAVGFYMFLINSTVRNIVIRQNLEAEASQLTLTLGSQEFSYISRRNSVTLALAYSLGFKDATVKSYINTKSPTNAVAFLSH